MTFDKYDYYRLARRHERGIPMSDEIEELRERAEAEVSRLKNTMQLHAVDCTSLQTESDERAAVLEDEIAALRVENEREAGFLSMQVEMTTRMQRRAEAAERERDGAWKLYDDLLTTWAESRERHLSAEAQVAVMREALDVLEREIGGFEFSGPHGRTTVGDFTRAALASASPGEK